MANLLLRDAKGAVVALRVHGSGSEDSPYQLTDAPCTHAAAVTPGAGAIPNVPATGCVIWANEDADVTVNTVGGETGVVFSMKAGSVLPVMVTHVTASTGDVVAMWNE